MSYLLDSDILIYYTNGVSEIQQLLETLAPSGLAISAVTYMETLQGIHRSPVALEAEQRLDE